VVAPLLKVLHSLHQLGIIHRDIKPENIFFENNGTLRLGDFGLAINAAKERPISRVGTLDYMAPEVCVTM
jgi:serine/threonine protein kinase